jgi:hypothetical protein
MDAFSFIREVEEIFTRYWGGHFEVVTAFFSRPRPREQLIAWLDLQLYKEIHVVPGKAQALIDMYEKLDGEVERAEYEAEAYEMADEIQHYRLLADVRELITGTRLKATEAKPTREQLRLEEVRRKYSTSKSPLVRAVSGFSPGGGVAFAAAGCMIDGGPVERLLAEAFKIIYRQEHVHFTSDDWFLTAWRRNPIRRSIVRPWNSPANWRDSTLSLETSLSVILWNLTA